MEGRRIVGIESILNSTIVASHLRYPSCRGSSVDHDIEGLDWYSDVDWQHVQTFILMNQSYLIPCHVFYEWVDVGN